MAPLFCCSLIGSQIARYLRSKRPLPSDHWHLDEMAIVIREKLTGLGVQSITKVGFWTFWFNPAATPEPQKAHPQAAEEANFAKPHYNGQARIPQCCVPETSPGHRACHRQTCQQPSREFASASSKTRAKNVAVQIARICTTLPQSPISHLQQLLLSTPSAQSNIVQAIS